MRRPYRLLESTTLFETLAVVTTITLVIVFVALFQMDRAGRKEEDSSL